MLWHYGGIYIDLDDGCRRKLDDLLVFPAWVRRTSPTGISNDAMGAMPRHPFFLRVIESLQAYDRPWLLPYITVMYSTGPLFLSVVWKEYLNEERPRWERVRVLMPDEYSKQVWSFFTIARGSSWHADDAQLIFWMNRHWLILTVAGFALAAAVGVLLWWCLVGLRVSSPSCSSAPGSPRGSPRRGTRSRFWNSWSRKSRPYDYELLDRTA